MKKIRKSVLIVTVLAMACFPLLGWSCSMGSGGGENGGTTVSPHITTTSTTGNGGDGGGSGSINNTFNIYTQGK